MATGGVRLGAGRKPNPNSVRQKAAAKRAAKAAHPKPPAKGFAPDGVKSSDAPAVWPFGTDAPKEPPKEIDPESDDGLTDEQRAGLSPLEYLLAVMRSPNASKSARMQAAVQAAPYIHPKPAPAAKKESAAVKSKEASGGKFKAASAPLKLVKNGF